jgi:hypothetical protein
MRQGFTRKTRHRVRSPWLSALLILAVFVAVGIVCRPANVDAQTPNIVVAAGPQQSEQGAQGGSDQDEKLTPEERMARRYPQPVRVGFLVGLPVLDMDDSTIGYIAQVVRTPAGKIQLVVPYNGWFGWVGNGGPFDRWRRPVAVPIETVAILARQVDVQEFSRQDFENAPTFQTGSAVPIAADDHIAIALGRR